MMMSGDTFSLSQAMQQYLTEQCVSDILVSQLFAFRSEFSVDTSVSERIPDPVIKYHGGQVLQMAMAALLQGQNLLLCGGKATGKNVLCDTLAWLFGRPTYDISFHVNTDSSSLIGTDTFIDNEVRLRKGPVYLCAEYGGFGILDEINMAKNDAVAVLHAALDHRRRIDVPGYSRITLHPATRFIGTMNQGYAGTRELNEALVSRFLVIEMPDITTETLSFLLLQNFPDLKEKAVEQFAGLFMDLQQKAVNGEISTKSLDFRGLLASIRTMTSGINPADAIRMGMLNKAFDSFEKEILEDVANTRIPLSYTYHDIFRE